MRSAALRFVLENERVSSAVLGPRNAAQLDQLVREARGEPPYIGAAKLVGARLNLSENSGFSGLCAALGLVEACR